MVSGNLFVSVILPVKFKEEVLYLLPDSFLHYNSPTAAGECKVAPGTRVRVHFGKREMIGVVRGFRYADRGEVPLERQGKTLEYKEIDGIMELPAIKREQLEFWQLLADYYLCTVGEVYKAAYPALAVRQESVKSRKSPELFLAYLFFP